MKTIFTKHLRSIVTLLLVVAMTVTSLSSCYLLNFEFGNQEVVIGTKEEILSEIEATLSGGGKARDKVEDYLCDWSLPYYDRNKFDFVELCFNQLFNLEGGLPEPLTHAAETAKLFLEHY